MSDLTESEVLDRMKTSLREAIQACQDLAVKSVKGRPYEVLRENLLLIEGCCRQLAAFRGDTRWLPIGKLMAECHQKAGGWLRGYKDPTSGIRIMTAGGERNKLFLMLAVNLADIHDSASTLYTAKTGTSGAILPATPTETRREGRPAFTQPKRKSTLILPTRLAMNR
jgi:hypothetical protein